MGFILKQIKVWLVLLIIGFFILSIGYIINDRNGLIAGLLIIFGITYFTLFYQPNSIFEELKAHKIQGQDPWMLGDLNSYLCTKIPMFPPEIWICENKKPLIFIIGPAYYRPTLIFSRGLIEKFKPHEIESLMLLSLLNLRFKNNSISIFFERWALSILNFQNLLYKIFPWVIFVFIKRIIEPIVSILFKLSNPSYQQIQADNEAKKHITNPSQLAQTVWNIYGALQTEAENFSVEALHYSLIAPATPTKKIISFQPKIEDRLKNLVGYFPI